MPAPDARPWRLEQMPLWLTPDLLILTDAVGILTQMRRRQEFLPLPLRIDPGAAAMDTPTREIRPVDRAPVQSMPDFSRRLSRFTAESLAATDQASLLHVISQFLGGMFSATFVELMVADGPSSVFRSVGNPSRTLERSVLSAGTGGNTFPAAEVADLLRRCTAKERGVLEGARGGLLLPLPGEGRASGVLLVGAARSGTAYPPDARAFLTVFASVVSIAVERNRLLEQMKTEQSRMSKMEKLASLGRLTAGIAHEFRNPLNIISTSAQTILRNPEDVALHVETGGYILEETERLTRTVDEFLQFAKPHTPVWEQVSVGEVAGGAVQGLQETARAKHVRIDTAVDPSLSRITTSPQHVDRILRNLGLNAIEAMSPGGILTIDALPHDSESIRITVSDTGPGIPPEHHARLFDPFFTTKPDGTGLGLAIVFMLIQAIRGSITFTSSPHGTSFHITLPVDGSRL